MTDLGPLQGEDQLEYEEDLEDLAGSLSSRQINATVGSSDWTTETLLSQHASGNIMLSPRFQRRDAWKVERKSRYVESLFLGLPVPQIVLAEKKEERGRFIVLDGKQRLLTLLQFTGSSDSNHNDFKLRGLDILASLNGLAYQEMLDLDEHASLLSNFHNETIRTVVIRNWGDPALLHLIFLRLNTGSVPLSPQELRQALYPGPFTDFVDDSSRDCVPLQSMLGLAEPDFRMRDVELLVRFFAFRYFLPRYTGDLRSFLDHACDSLNASFADQRATLVGDQEQFGAAIDASHRIFPVKRRVFVKWKDGAYQPHFNRAVFDTMMFYFSDPAIRATALESIEDVRGAYEQLCAAEDGRFLTALEVTTKSIGATSTRLQLWGEALADALRMDIEVPRLTGERIEIRA